MATKPIRVEIHSNGNTKISLYEDQKRLLRNADNLLQMIRRATNDDTLSLSHAIEAYAQHDDKGGGGDAE